MSASTSGKAIGTSRSSSDSPFLPLADSLANASRNSEGQDQLAQHKVVMLEHMKEEGQTQHEYVIATIRDHNENTAYLSIGRSKGQNGAPQARDHKKCPLKKSYSSRSRSTLTLGSIPDSSQDSILKPTAAVDVVQNIKNKESIARSRVQCVSQHPIPLLRLAIIIAAVHDQNTSYTVLRNQCYWFAMLIMGVSMTLGRQVTSFIEKSSKAKPLKHVLPNLGPNGDPSGWSQIPILSSPLEESYETVRNVGPSVGKHIGVPVVMLNTEDIRFVALEVQRRYEVELNKQAVERNQREAAAVEEIERQRMEAREQAQKEAAEEIEMKTREAREVIANLRRELAAAQQHHR